MSSFNPSVIDWTVHPLPLPKPSTADSITHLIHQVLSNAKRGRPGHGSALKIKKLTDLTGLTRNYVQKLENEK